MVSPFLSIYGQPNLIFSISPLTTAFQCSCRVIILMPLDFTFQIHLMTCLVMLLGLISVKNNDIIIWIRSSYFLKALFDQQSNFKIYFPGWIISTQKNKGHLRKAREYSRIHSITVIMCWLPKLLSDNHLKVAGSILTAGKKQYRNTGAHSVMVIIVGNGLNNTNSNPRQGWLHLT